MSARVEWRANAGEMAPADSRLGVCSFPGLIWVNAAPFYWNQPNRDRSAPRALSCLRDVFFFPPKLAFIRVDRRKRPLAEAQRSQDSRAALCQFGHGKQRSG